MREARNFEVGEEKSERMDTDLEPQRGDPAFEEWEEEGHQKLQRRTRGSGEERRAPCPGGEGSQNSRAGLDPLLTSCVLVMLL